MRIQIIVSELVDESGEQNNRVRGRQEVSLLMEQVLLLIRSKSGGAIC